MNAIQAIARIQAFGMPVATTADISALLQSSVDSASKMLVRLARSGLVVPLRHGLWSLTRDIDPHLLPAYITAPYPSYISLQSALRHHDMISQIPQITYVVSLDRARRVTTNVQTFSIHKIAPELFGGFDILPSGIRMATPEKALFDVFYLSGTRTGFFSSLPELELPASFKFEKIRNWIERTSSRRLRTMIEAKVSQMSSTRTHAA